VSRQPKILIVDTCYPGFLRSVGYTRQALIHERHDDLREAFMKFRFGTSDAYSRNLRSLGWDAQEIIPNSLLLQSAWAHEHDVRLSKRLAAVSHSALSRVPGIRSVSRLLPSLHRVLEAQVESTAPDVIYFQDLNFAPPRLLERFRRHAKLVIGQIASPLPPATVLRSYDLIFSSLPNQVEQIGSLGVPSEFLAIGFDERILKEISVEQRDLPLTFVGGVSKHHSATLPLLSTLSEPPSDLQIFGYGGDQLPTNLQALHQGESWGADMYRVLLRSQITLNRHIDVAEGFANNMRLFEATGCGALLVTDKAKDLNRYFSDDEVLSYSKPADARNFVKWAQHEPERAKEMADRAQRRTLTEHSYVRRMEDLSRSLHRHMKWPDP
jgi:hypothetical protein